MIYIFCKNILFSNFSNKFSTGKIHAVNIMVCLRLH